MSVRRLLRQGGLGVLAGLALAAALLCGWRVQAGAGTLGLDLTLRSASSGELEVLPAAPLAHVSALRPGGPPLTGTMSVRNQTGLPLRAAFRAAPSLHDTDAALWLELRAGRRVVVRDPLSRLRGSTGGLRLRSGERRELTVRAWLPAGAASGWRGRIVDVSLVPEVKPA
ncbi:MAG TPA: hypothetical protein VF752_05575 [Thermoleophilaceae bacterium]